MSGNVNLASVVSVSRRFQRSTNLESDKDDIRNLDGYILQESGRQCLDSMARFFNETSQRAFTWTGSFGSGKSSLALFLSAILLNYGPARKKALKILGANTEKTKHIYQAFVKDISYDVITLTGHRGSLATDFLAATDPHAKSAREAIKKIIKKYRQLNKGLVIFIDELGKYLEDGNSDNCYFLQELAEAANRSNTNFLIIGILHQAFDAYANQLTKAQRDEWAKVQGRYVDIPLFSAASEVLQLLDKSIHIKKGFTVGNLEPSIAPVIKELSHARQLDKSSFESTLRGVYPINSVSAILLGTLSRQSFLQNTRSVFNFLNSREPFAFNDFIENTFFSDEIQLYSPDLLWDYLQTNLEQTILSNPANSHRWMMARDCIERASKLESPVALKVAKIIAIIDLFKRGSGLEATSSILKAALYPIDSDLINEATKELENHKVIIFRKYLKAYALFEGSDFNLDEALSEILSQGEELNAKLINNLLQLQPVIARRHYATTGTLRWFSREIHVGDDLTKTLAIPKNFRGAGRLILVLAAGINNNILCNFANQTSGDCFFAIPNKSELIVNLAKELQAIESLSKRPELEGDAIARKEINIRKEYLTIVLSEELQKAFCDAIWLGKDRRCVVRNSHDLNVLLSNFCDRTYSKAPLINNKLINRDQVSSNITRARKILMRSMLDNGDQERLAIKEFPPEAMIYASILRAGNLHHFDSTKNHFIFDTSDQKGAFSSLWKGTDSFFKNHKKPSLAELYDFWGSAPYGIKNGVKPILALCYLLANLNKISVYVRDVFQAEISDEILENWLFDPRDIRFRYVESSTERSELLEKLDRSMNQIPGISSDGTELGVARAIVRVVLTCPKWALNTAQLAPNTKKFRDTVIKAWDPLELIYQNLPEIFATNDSDTIVAETTSALSEIQAVTPQMLLRVREYLLTVLDARDSAEALPNRAKNIKGLAGQMQMEAFVTRISRFDNSDAAIEGIISLAVAKPKPQWTDRDIDMALTKISDWALNFRHLESMAHLHNRQSSRRMISIVVGGQSGTSSKIIDLPTNKSAAVLNASTELKQLLSKLPKDVALAALIEQGVDLLKD